MIKYLQFEPFPLFACPHKQTICGSLLKLDIEPISVRQLVPLEDGDQIALEIVTPEKWKDSDPTVFFVHGLCGSHRSPYLIRLVKRFQSDGIRTVRFNMRGCGSGKGLSRKIYHSGCSEDVIESLKAVHRKTPDSPIYLVGFSLGGNVVLKTAGELGSLGSKLLKGVISISPPVDLKLTGKVIGSALNGLYEAHFSKLMKAHVAEIHAAFSLPEFRFPEKISFYDFDRIYKIPTCGFKSVDDYYTQCSSVHYLDQINIPCKILFAEDDPVIPHSRLDREVLPKNITIYKTKNGGHLGYLGNPRAKHGFRFMDNIINEWIKEMLSL
jgi:hypothetical protein